MMRTKVLQVGLDWFDERPGGLSRYYCEALRATSEHFETRGLVVGSSGVQAQTGGQVRAFASQGERFVSRMSASRTAVADELRTFRPDVVVSHFAPHVFPALDLVRKRPLVTQFHGPWAAESRAEGASAASTWLKARIERTVYGRSTSFVVLSEAFKRLLAESYAIAPERIHVVPGGVDAAAFEVGLDRDGAKARLGLRPDRDYVFCIRRLVRRMGIENLIDAMSRLRDLHPNVVLLIGGRGPLQAELEARVGQQGLGPNVTILGGVATNDLPLYYRASLFSVVPSVSLEGFGLTTLESLAAGTPVLTTPVGGLREIMASFAPALVADGISTEDIAALLARVLANRDLLVSREACEAYAARHDWAAIGQRLATIYESTREAFERSSSTRTQAANTQAVGVARGAEPSACGTPSLSVVIASYRRANDLERCIAALARQSEPPDDVNVVYREEDRDTAAMLERVCRTTTLSLRLTRVDEPGVVAARNRGLATTFTDIVAMIDDDTEPPPGWAGRLRQHYASNPRLGALGGRDAVYLDGVPVSGRREIVGKLQWFGRVIGNHHLGHGPIREVDVLKGANMSFRMAAVRGLRFNEQLRGEGAQPWEDAEFSLSIKRAGWPVMYDPDLVVRHNQASRAEARHYATLGVVSRRERHNYKCFCFNEVIAVWPSLSPSGKLAYLVFSTLVGTGVTPGLVQVVRLAGKLRLAALDRFVLCQTGKWQAFAALTRGARPQGHSAAKS